MRLTKPTTNYSLLVMLALLLFSSCKSTKIVTDGTVNKDLTAKAAIKAHYQNATVFNMLSGKVKISLEKEDSSQTFGANLRMEKDKAIWLSSTPIPLVKAYITPDRVTFYNKLQNEYFDGNFSYLNKLLGAEIDFSMLQNVLLGEAIIDLRKGNYAVTAYNNNYRLLPKSMTKLFEMLFDLEPQRFKIAMQQLAQLSKKQVLKIAYNNYQKIDGQVLPSEVRIEVLREDETSTIALDFRNLELNKPLRFPYNIPNGYKEIILE